MKMNMANFSFLLCPLGDNDGTIGFRIAGVGGDALSMSDASLDTFAQNGIKDLIFDKQPPS